MNNDTLASVLRNHGSFGDTELASLAVDYPNLYVCAKMGCSLRFTAPVRDMAKLVAARIEQNRMDYVREYFIPCQAYDALCMALGIEKDY